MDKDSEAVIVLDRRPDVGTLIRHLEAGGYHVRRHSTEEELVKVAHGEADRLIIVHSPDTEARGPESDLGEAAVSLRLAGSIAHDINNQLTVIASTVQFLLGEMQPDHPAREDLQRIRAAGGRGTYLVQHLLALDNTRTTRLHSIDLREILHEMAAILDPLPGEQIRLQVRADLELWQIRADPDEMEHLILNLIVNAKEAMAGASGRDSTGTLTVDLANVQLDGDSLRPLVKRVASGPYVMLAVSDTGPGMSDDVRKRVFDPFFTTKERGKGSGLGLATVLDIVKSYRGYVVCSSEVGRGSTFKVYLPREESDAPWPGQEPVPTSGPVDEA